MIEVVQRHLSAIYDIEAPDIRDFMVDREAAERLRGPGRAASEWVFVAQEDDEVGIGVYVDDRDLAAVESAGTPAAAVRDALASFCVVTEGVSHFLLLTHRAARDEPVSLLELETQAEVDKYVTARLHERAAGTTPDPTLRRRLFEDARPAEGLDATEDARYREAGRLAGRYCEHLDGLRDVDRVLAELRRFYRRAGHARMESLRHAA